MDPTLRFQILPERAHDAPAIPDLLDRTFGPERRGKTVYRLRDGIRPVPELCFVAADAGAGDEPERAERMASLRFWPIRLSGGRTPEPDRPQAILLGPLAVEPKQQGRGLGRALVRHALDRARRIGVDACIVVGEPEYYQPYGFEPATPHGLILPGPVEPHRFQVLEMVPGVLERARGPIRRDERYADPAWSQAGSESGAAPGRHLRRA